MKPYELFPHCVQSLWVDASFWILKDPDVFISDPYSHYFCCSAVKAEVIKYMENSYLATKVSFVNQFYDIANLFGADWHRVREGWLLDERIGRAFSTVFADNRGFGGKCLPKDVSAIVKAAEEKGYDANILKAILEYNNTLQGK